MNVLSKSKGETYPNLKFFWFQLIIGNSSVTTTKNFQKIVSSWVIARGIYGERLSQNRRIDRIFLLDMEARWPGAFARTASKVTKVGTRTMKNRQGRQDDDAINRGDGKRMTQCKGYIYFFQTLLLKATALSAN